MTRSDIGVRRADRAAPSVRVVLFDAVGTLIHPHPPVAEVYQRAGHRFGSRRTVAEIEPRFRQALARHSDDGPTDEARERRRWQAIVADVFDDLPAAGEELFAELWRHFAQSRHWRLFDDVAAAWDALRRRGVRVGIASNFDQRLCAICRELEPLSDAEYLFVSSQIGFPKPRAEFFQRVQQQLDVDPREILLVGDDADRDVAGARAAGWQSLRICRQGDAADGSMTTLAQIEDRLSSSS